MEKFDVLESTGWLAFQQIVISLQRNQRRQPPSSNDKPKVWRHVNAIQHPSMIKFWAIHHKTMESYTLWWNGGSLASFLQKLNSKVSEAIPLENIKFSSGELLPDELDKVTLYQRNRTKLALSLLIIVEKCHAHGIQYNDLSPGNILLYFPPMDKTKIFLGVCDLGMACRISEKVASNYGYRSEEEMAMQQRLRQDVAPELFYVFGPRGSETSLERQKKKHMFTKGGDAYAAGKMASMIWREEPDKEMLPASKQFAAFRYKLRQLTDPNPNTRATLSDALGMLTSDPIKIRLPTECFRTGI